MPNRYSMTEFDDRLVEAKDGCLEFVGVKGPRKGLVRLRNGKPHYGQFIRNGITRPSHVFAWEREHGPVPIGLQVCHRCDNPPCCNVDHLFLGTDKENKQDMVSKGRHRNQQKTHCPKGHPYSDENTYFRANGRRICRACDQDTQAKRRRAAGAPIRGERGRYRKVAA